MRALSFSCAAVVAAMVMSSAASAAIHGYTFVNGAPGMPAANHDAGLIDSFNTTFDTVSKRLTFSVSFGAVPSNPGAGLVTNGFWVAINAGPNPKGNAGEMALFYFDAQSILSPKMTVYAYNGVNGPNSWQDGNPSVANNQTADLIHGVNDNSYKLSPLSVLDTGAGASARRTMSFNIDASQIISHTPLYPDAVDPWTGTGFGNSLGIWFHPVKGWNASYNNTTGRITSLSTPTQGWVDASFLQTNQIPTPGAGALGAVVVGLCVRRRRRTTNQS